MAFLNNKEVGERLIKVRGDVSSRKYAITAGIDPSQYTKIEKGELPLTEKILEKLATAYNIKSNFILYGKNTPHKDDENVFEKKAVSLPKEIGYINERLISIEASINVLLVNQAEINSVHHKTSVLKEVAELRKVISVEADRIFDEERKKALRQKEQG